MTVRLFSFFLGVLSFAPVFSFPQFAPPPVPLRGASSTACPQPLGLRESPALGLDSVDSADEERHYVVTLARGRPWGGGGHSAAWHAIGGGLRTAVKTGSLLALLGPKRRKLSMVGESNCDRFQSRHCIISLNPLVKWHHQCVFTYACVYE